MGNTFDHVLHIGAGLCAQLPEYLAAGARSITLFEPDPETAALLRAQTAQTPEVLVVEAAVSVNTEPQQLYRFSFADLNSLRAPTGLNRLFPSLELLGADPVRVQNPVELVQGLQLSETGTHMLVLDASGEAFSILSALDEAGLLSQFRHLQINEGRDVLYEGATPLVEIGAWLESCYFSKNIQWDNSDTERPVLSVTYNDLCAALADLAATQAQAEALQQALTTKTSAYDAQSKVLETQQQSSAQKLEAMEKAITDRIGERDTLQDQLEVAEYNLSMSLRMQALRESDLQDLQQRYKGLLLDKEAQGELLGRLTASLNNAAIYLEDMEAVPERRLAADTTDLKAKPMANCDD